MVMVPHRSGRPRRRPLALRRRTPRRPEGRRGVQEWPPPGHRPELARGGKEGVLTQVGSGSFGPCRVPVPPTSSLAYGACRLPEWASRCSRSCMCGECSSNAGRSERIRGISRKLCRGGGEEVAHSSELPCPQGSSRSASRPYFQDFTTL